VNGDLSPCGGEGAISVGVVLQRGETAVRNGTVLGISRADGPKPLRTGMTAADRPGSAQDEAFSEGEITVLDARGEFARSSRRYRDRVTNGGRIDVGSPR